MTVSRHRRNVVVFLPVWVLFQLALEHVGDPRPALSSFAKGAYVEVILNRVNDLDELAHQR